jgi:hypothetical protein
LKQDIKDLKAELKSLKEETKAEARKRDAELTKLDKLLEKTGTLERVVKLLWLYYLTYFFVQGDLFGTFALQVARSLLLEICE